MRGECAFSARMFNLSKNKTKCVRTNLPFGVVDLCAQKHKHSSNLPFGVVNLCTHGLNKSVTVLDQCALIAVFKGA